MIDIKDLQIGDWVRIMDDALEHQYLNDYKPGQIIQVTEILDRGINPDWMGGEVNDLLHLDIIEPIPLTAEILEKNGFARDEIAGWRFRQYEDGLGLIYEIYWNNKGDELEIVSNLSKIGGFDKKGIQFVHQLQNALRLCGIDKEIEL